MLKDETNDQHNPTHSTSNFVVICYFTSWPKLNLSFGKYQQHAKQRSTSVNGENIELPDSAKLSNL